MGDPAWGRGVRRPGSLGERVGEKCGRIKGRGRKGKKRETHISRGFSGEVSI